MDQQTQAHFSGHYAQRYHSDPAFDQVLSVFFDQGHTRLVPSFLAYELDLTTHAAESLLDEMVKHSLLELDFDDNGSLHYSLDPDVRFELEQHPGSTVDVGESGHGQAARPFGWQPSNASGPPVINDWPLFDGQANEYEASPQGFDGTVGHGTVGHGTVGHRPAASAGPGRQPTHATRLPAFGPDGCDGTVGHPGERSMSPASYGHESRSDHPYARDGRVESRPPRFDEHASSSHHRKRHHDHQLVRQTHSDLPVRQRRVEPMIAALLSVLLVGTGQLYNRDVGKGVAFFVVYAVLLTTFFPIGWMINVWAAVDAYSSAQRRNAETA